MQAPPPEHDDTFDFLFKIILIGDTNVGKTCVLQNFKSGVFSDKQQNTIGVDFTVRTVDIEGKKVKVSFPRSVCFRHTGDIKLRSINLKIISAKDVS